jgi:2-phosphosulfolactate phosphatase
MKSYKSMENIFNQSPFQCRMDWGIRGVKEASLRGDIIIVVDVLSFSSAITNAIHQEAIIYPFPRTGDINEFGKLVEAEVCILERARARELGLPSLSATSFNESHKGKRYVISSINGATCVKEANENNYIFIGCLLNASAVASVVNQIQKDKNLNITVIASGERWSGTKDEPRDLRPSIEDYLGAGAILELLDGTKSPEAQVCIGAYKNSKSELNTLILDCSSGRELVSMGFPEDVKFCSQVDVLKEVPILTQDKNGYSYFKNYLN